MSSYSIIAFQGANVPKEYINLIYSKWLRSLRFGNDFFKLADSDSYYDAYQNYIKVLLNKPNAMVRLAVLTDEKDVVLGFSVYRGYISNIVLDYVHVHKDHRKLGIGTRLLPHGVSTITHLTRTGLSIWGSKYGYWSFNPFA